MATLNRYEVAWNGLTGLPGVGVFYSLATVDAAADLKTFFNAIKGQFPSPLSWTIPAEGDQIESTTGTLTGSWTSAGGGTVTSTTAGSYEGGNGAYIRWGTPLIVNGRRLIGRTFLAPIKSDQFDSGGVVSAAAIAIIQPAINTLVTAGKIGVWHRPNTKGAGTYNVITAGTLQPTATSLKTRRR